MMINWKIRWRNTTFVVTFCTLVISFIYQLLGLFGVVPPIAEETAIKALGIIVNILAAVGVLVDPTTDGMRDSDRAMTYGTPEDVRISEAEVKVFPAPDDEGADVDNGTGPEYEEAIREDENVYTGEEEKQEDDEQ